MKITLQGRDVAYGTGSADHLEGSKAIVFVHGAGFDHSVWVMPARYFARHKMRVVAPSLPAHGQSAGPALTSIEAMVDWLAGLLDELMVSDSIVVGHSMGSLVALAFAAKYPSRVSQLALLGTSAPMPVGGVLLDAAHDNSPAAYAMANTWSHANAGGLGASSVPGVSNFLSGQRWLQRMAPDVYHADLQACHRFEPDLSKVRARVLIINGAQDKMTPGSASKRLAAELSNQTNVASVTLPGCGHSMLSERPNEVLDALIQFVSPDEAD